MHLTNELRNPCNPARKKKEKAILLRCPKKTLNSFLALKYIQPQQQHERHTSSTRVCLRMCMRVCVWVSVCLRLCPCLSVHLCLSTCVSLWAWLQTAVALVIHPGSQGSQLLLPDAWEAAGVEWQQQLLSPIWLLIRELSPLSDTRHSPLSKQWFQLVKH